MKVKFELSEFDRLQAYYLLQLRVRDGHYSDPQSLTFDKFLNDFAKEQFRIGLGTEISKLEERLLRVEV